MTTIRMLVTGSLLAGLVWMVDVDELLTGIGQAEPVWLFAAFLLMPVNIGLEVVKWRALLQPSNRTSWTDAAGSVLIGYTLGLLSPARVGEYVGRAVYLPGSRLQTALLTGIDRMLSMVICIAAGLSAAVIAIAMGIVPATKLLLMSGLLGIVVAACLLVLLLKPHQFERLLAKASASMAWRDAIRFLKTAGLPGSTLLFGLSAARHVVFTAQLIILVAAFGGAAAWLALVICATLVFFVKTLIPQITFADLGIRESAAIFFFGLIGVSAQAALNASLVLFSLNLAMPALAGIVFVQRLRLSPTGFEKVRARLKWTARL